MELRDTPTAVTMLILLAILIGIGVLVIDKIATTQLESSTGVDTITASNSTYQTLALRPVTSVTSAVNASNVSHVIAAANITLLNSKVLISDDRYNGESVNVTYLYSSNTTATDDMRAARDAIGEFSTDWMSLFVVVIAAAIILGMVLVAFKYRR